MANNGEHLGTAPARGLCFGFFADTSFVRITRRVTADTLALWQLGAVADDIVLLVSELVSNAVAEAAGQWIEFGLKLESARLIVEVWDPIDKEPDTQPKLPADDREDGRGLYLVETLATSWTIVRTPPKPGKSIVAVLDLPATATQDGRAA